MSQTPNTAIAVIGIDIGKNSFHVVCHDARGAIVLRQKWSRGQVEARLANIPPCLIGMEACVGAHRLSATPEGSIRATWKAQWSFACARTSGPSAVNLCGAARDKKPPGLRESARR